MKSCTVYDFFIFLITFIHIFIYNVVTKRNKDFRENTLRAEYILKTLKKEKSYD